MKLTLTRPSIPAITTIGTLAIDGVYFCDTLEDFDRGLFQAMSLQELKKLKVYGQTAIPYGEYKIKIAMSSRYKRLMPYLVNVPAYDGIMIHPLNKASETLGCIGVGKKNGNDMIVHSRATFNQLLPILQANECTIEIKKQSVVIA